VMEEKKNTEQNKGIKTLIIYEYLLKIKRNFFEGAEVSLFLCKENTRCCLGYNNVVKWLVSFWF